MLYLQGKSYKQLALEVVLLRRKATHISEINMSNPIGTALAIPWNSMESDLGCTFRIYFDNVTLMLHNMTLMSQKTWQHNYKCQNKQL